MEKSVYPRNLSRLCITLIAACAIVAGCGTRPIQPSDKHIQRPVIHDNAADIPQPLTRTVALPAPKPGAKPETYSVVVTNIPAQEILFALARDAKINLDIHPGIQGTVTLNALDQTLPQILTRIAKQIDMRYELENGNLIVMPDSPYLRSYKIDYVNMTRDAESSINNAMQVSNTGGSATGTGGSTSSIAIKNTSKNRFWETLVQNIKDILHETDKILPDGSSETVTEQSGGTDRIVTEKKNTAKKIGNETTPTQVTIQEGDSRIVTRRNTFREAASVIANPENGLITVRATGKQHERIREFIDQVMNNARRQVMIEATIVEVRLSDQYKQGINWSALIKAGGKGFKVVQSSAGLPTNVGNGVFGIITNPTAATVTQQVSLLESFGDVRVLSSPKLSVLNNQTAMMRVVDNLVYFTVKADTVATQNAAAITTYTTTPNTIPVGFTMSVTPQISDNDVVLLNLKPSISRVIRYVPDPNPNLGVNNQGIPETQTREMESVMRVENNQIAVMGGLMQDSINNLTDAIPGVSRIPVAGELFKQRNDTTTKTELVIFLRPVIIKDASIVGDFSAYRDMLPDQNFFKQEPGQENFGEPSSGKP
ncbi:MAG: pilus (MSHA type) biogenesis protein MshL [Gallionellales bacterium GWA2_60_142]|nr:MAG: pilus (MSHA type) biogenesis protein MshL [Gallionellales bacterium GWA2_60_142]HCI13890.1 pilus (MSHA type) biogenesis protein MshL [Gallionellaceae bacterium]